MENKIPTTVGQTAPESTPAPVARPKTIERQGNSAASVTERYPEIRGGICEFCGVVDGNLPSEEQYKLCPHFRGLGQLRCSYCDETKDPDDIINHSVIKVAGHPDNPDKLVVWCDSYTCSGKHLKRFSPSGN